MKDPATIGQLPEIIHVEGVLYSLFTQPLLPWLRAQDPPITFDRRTPKCDRGYVGRWRVEDGTLWLYGLYGWRAGKHAGVASLFDGQREVVADWFSGPLIVEPTAESVRTGEYPKPKTLMVENGVLAADRQH